MAGRPSLARRGVIRARCTRDRPALSSSQDAAALAVADAALAAIGSRDSAGVLHLMLPEAVTFPIAARDGVARYRVRTRAEERAPA
jgi:hypothetical protein